MIDKLIKFTENKDDRALLIYILSSRSDYMNILTVSLNNESTFKNMLEIFLKEACDDSIKTNTNNNSSTAVEFLQTMEIVKEVKDNNQIKTDRQMIDKILAHCNSQVTFLNLR